MEELDKATHCQLLIDFIKVCNAGSVKPYDSAMVLQNLARARGVTSEMVEEVMKCCPPSAEVRDAKDFIPYRNKALRKLEELLDI